jgi:hypothetical protein
LAKADPTLASARGRFSREASRSLLAGSEQMQKDTYAAEVVGQLHPPAANRVVAARDVMRVYGEGETAA